MGAFKPQRVTLTAGVVTPITPPRSASAVTIGNATADDLRVYDDPTDTGTNYFVIAAGYAQDLPVPIPHFFFDPHNIAFYLNALAGGVAVITWR